MVFHITQIGIIKGVQEPYTVVLVIFCCLKIFLNPFTDRITNLISVVSVRAERGEIMKPSSFESAIRLQFDCLIRKVIDRTVENYYMELGRRAKHEIPFCDVTETDLNHAGVIDEYSVEYSVFLVYGIEIHVYDERLCKAIQKLKDRQRNIILMFYFLDMSDTEIGEIIGISICSVYRGRMRALSIIRENYTEE